MTEKAKSKGLTGRPLLLTNPLTLLPVIGAGSSNRIYRAEETTAPAEPETAPSPSTPPAQSVALSSQLASVIPPLILSPDDPVIESYSLAQSAAGADLSGSFGVLPAPPIGLFYAYANTLSAEPGRGFAESYRDLPEPLVQRALSLEMQQQAGAVAFQTEAMSLEMNQDGIINSQDIQILYYLTLFQQSVIDRATLTMLLNNLGQTPLSADDSDPPNTLRSQDLPTTGTIAGIPALDLNNDNSIDLQDVRILYYAYRFADILRASPSLRETLLGDLTTEDDGADADRDGVYMAILDSAAALRPPVTAGDGELAVVEGTSYTLTSDDLSARDPDDANAALSWTVTAAPINGRLALSGAPGTAILSFTQQQLEAGEVVYVHTGSDDSDDSFEVRLQNPADPEGIAQVPPVPLTVTVSTPVVDMAPTEVTLSNVIPQLAEDADVSARTRVADIAVTDADLGPRDLELVGADAALFELSDDQTELLLRAGVALDFETNPDLEVSVRAVRNPSEATADLSLALTKANEAPITTGDGEFQVVEGASYTLTPNDLAATDVDDAAADLTWTFMTGAEPANGHLELSTAAGTAIDSFTQAQLEASEVVYVHDGSNAPSDGFTLQVADDDGLQAADPVIVNVDITRILDSIDLTELAAADGFIIRGDAAEDQAGFSVSGAGDVNGDGYIDLIIGAHRGDDGGTDAGEAYIVFGKASGFGHDVSTVLEDGTTVVHKVIELNSLAPADGFIVRGDAAGDQAGFSVSGAGDVNGDGFADLLIGVIEGDDGGTNAGEAYLIFGKQDGFGSVDSSGRRSIDLESLNTDDGFIIQGDVALDTAGFSVSGAGDVNGDGYTDLLIGARSGDDGGMDSGEAYVVFGKASGFGNDVSITLEDGTITDVRRVVDLTSLDTGDGFIIQGDAGFDFAGFSVSGAGDVNGDGYADLIIGAPSADVDTSDGNKQDAGEAYVIFGKEGDPSDPFGNPMGGRQVVDLESLAPEEGFIIQGGANFDFAGTSVSGAGDVNGDGYADLIIGAVGSDDGGTYAGAAYVIFGKEGDPSDPFGSPDGTRRVIDLSNLNAADGFTIQGDDVFDLAGRSVSGAGDVNGDGFADLLVGAYRSDDGGTHAGEAYVIFGKDSAPSDPFGNPDGTRRVIDLGNLDAADGFAIQGDAADDQAGTSVSAAGDVNGDGFADLLVGANLADVNNPAGDRVDVGEAYVVFGGPAGLSTEAVAVLGTDGDDFLNVDGEATVVLAGAGDDVLNIDGFGDADLLKLDGGTGTDTLCLVNLDLGTNPNPSLHLDLSTLADSRISSIEHIDLSGNGDNSLTLTRLDLLNLSEVRTEGRAELRVDGNAGDRVTVTDDGWVQRADVMIEGTTYKAFENGNARLLVNIAVDIGGIIPTVDLTDLTAGDGFIIQGDEAGDHAGVSVSGAGDVNGDGYTDLIVGARFGDDGGTDAGEAYVVFGKASDPSDPFGELVGGRQVMDLTNLAPEEGFIIQGDARYDFAGYSVSGAGDVNGDGFADLLVGAPSGWDGGLEAGEAYVVFGKASGFGNLDGSGRQVVDLTSLAAGDGFVIQGDVHFDWAGASVSGAGDVNGDGFTDLIVGAHKGDDGGTRAGEAYVVFGKASDPSDPFGELVGGRQVVDLTSLAPDEGFIIQGDERFDRAGVSVSGAGDVNGDGYADLIVGASRGDDGGTYAGEAYVLFGKASGFGELDDSNRRVMDLTDLAPTEGFIIQGDEVGDTAGSSVSYAGDVNGDGYADLIVGAPCGSDGGHFAGEAYVVFGKASGFGSLDGTGRRVVDLTSLAVADGFIIQGDAVDDQAGVSISAAGDVNGDGFADLIVGADQGDDGGTDAGEAYVIFGKASDPSDPFGSLDSSGRRVIDLSNLDAEEGFIIQGDAAGDQAGSSVSAAGDVNGDGFADLIVGAPHGDDGGINAGEAYVLFGGPAGLSTEAVAVLGTDGNDDLNVDGEATVVLAGAGDDVLNIDGFGDADLLKLDGGTGTDTLCLVNLDAGTNPNSSLHLDLSTLADSRISSIEHIDLSGNGDNSLTLTRLDLLNLSEVRTEGRAELRVDGNAGDRVTVTDDGWVQRADVMIEGTTYKAFENGNARLLVNIAVDIGGIIPTVDLTDLTAGDGFIIQGDEAGDHAGVSVSGAGDVNGDGYTDLIVGARFGDDGGTDAGEAYVVFGKASDPSDPFGELVGGRQVMDLTNLAPEEGFVIQGDARYDFAGYSVSGAGDVNGDGFADLLVGAPSGWDGGLEAGEAYVVFGKASGFGNLDGSGRQVVDLTSLAAGDGFVIQGDVHFDWAGASVSAAGDVNGDGFTDLIVGAHKGDDGGTRAGEAYVVFGKDDEFGSPDNGDRQVVDLTSLAPDEGFIIQGDESFDRAGVSVSGAGDVNGDGYADLIVGASRGDDGGIFAGEAYVVFGKASGFGELDDSNRRVMDLTDLTATEGFIIQGDEAGDTAGSSVSHAGDVNGDGFADLIVGAPCGSDGGHFAGEAYVVFGKASGFGSLDGTGRRVVDLTSLAVADGFIIQGDAVDDQAGVSISAAGDVNGDGFADLIVGAYQGDDGGTDAGEAYVIFGKASDPSDPFGSLDSSGRRVIDLSNLDAEEGFIIQGDAAYDQAGFSVSAAGDVNGDGFADLIVGAPHGDDGGTNAGEAYVLFGGPAGLSTEAAAVLGTDGNDDLNVDGEATVVLAGAGDDVLNIDGFGDADLLKLDGGTGTDTLCLVNLDAGTNPNSSLHLDLSTLADSRISSIEHIDLSGNGDNSLTLTRLDLLNLSEVRSDGQAELRVDGNAGDRVTLNDDGWVRRGTEEIEGTTYKAFENGNARLLVNIAIDISGLIPTVDLTDLTAGEGFIIQGDEAGDGAGRSVSDAGDVNGDGYADLIVGARFGDDGGRFAGEAYVVFGKASDPSDPFGELVGGRQVMDLTNLAPEEGFIIQGDAGYDFAGHSVSGAGDVNGDGFADLIVGAPSGWDGGINAGEAYVVFGKASAPSDPFGSLDGSGRQVVDLTSLAAGDGFVIQGDVHFDWAGASVSAAGDVNGDGFADLIVGVNQGNDGGIDAGEAYVLFGKASDSFGSPDGTNRQVVDLTSLAPEEGFIIQGDAAFDEAGVSVSGAGDVNGDGYADLIVGAHFGDDGGSFAGEAYVVFGKASGFGELDDSNRRVMDLTNLAPTEGFIIQGDEAGDTAGASVSYAGDVNGDGFADLIVGAPCGNDGGRFAGEAYVVFGKASGFGELDGTGRRVVDLTSLAAADGFIIQGDAVDDQAGVSISAAGDVNGDGFADLIVGAHQSDDGGDNAGETYVVFGKASDPFDPFGSLDSSGRRVIDLSNLDAADGFIIQGDEAGDRAGRSVSAAGDVNGDGFADLIVGAPYGDDGGTDAGEAYVLFGGPAGLSTEAAAVLGTDGNDDLNADGEATVVLAGAGDDVLNIDGFGDADLLKFDGGTGTDTLCLVNLDAGTNPNPSLHLDLSTLADSRISSIEHIDLSGNGDNSLTLTRLDLLNLSEVRTDGRAELRVDGNAGDRVSAPDEGWARSADVMIEGTMYRTFDNGNARLLVNMDVALGGNLMATSQANLAEALQNCCVTQTVDVRALINALPPEDEAQQRRRMEDELAMLGPLPEAQSALEAEQPAAVAEPDVALFELPSLIPDEG